MAMFINDRPMQKVLLKNTTRMSLHERFTYLRSNSGDGNNQVQRQRDLQQQTARNRRLALQMERRPAVMAALKLKKKSLRQRLGLAGAAGMGGSIGAKTGFNSIKDRLSLGNRKGRKVGRGGIRLGQGQQSPQQRRGRQRGGGGGGPNARGRLSRSQSMQSLNSAGKFTNRARSRSRSRSRVRANSISQNNLNVNNNNQMRFRSRSRNRAIVGRGSTRGGSPRFTQRGRQGGRGGRGSIFRGRRIANNWGSGRGRRGNDRGRGGRGRGAGSRGRGRGVSRGGRGRRGGGNNPVPTKEELDNQLDQYMANSRYKLDEDIDSYMKEAYSTGAPSMSKTAATQEESWD